MRAHRGRVGDRLEAGRHAREERGTERAAFGNRAHVHREDRCSRPAPRPIRRRACRRRSRRCGAAGIGDASIMRRVTNPDASNAARRTAAASCVRSRSTSCARRVGILERHALAARVRHPHGHACRVDRRRARCRRRMRSTQLRNSPPALLGPPTRNLPRARCAGSRSGTRNVDRLVGMTAHTISVVPRITSTSPTSSRAGDELLGERVDRAALEHAARRGRAPRRAVARRRRSSASARHARRTRRASASSHCRSSRTAGSRSRRRSSR